MAVQQVARRYKAHYYQRCMDQSLDLDVSMNVAHESQLCTGSPGCLTITLHLPVGNYIVFYEVSCAMLST